MSEIRAGIRATARKLIGTALRRDLSVFVVPGVRVARSAGLDLDAAGIRVAATPRHASVLLVVADLPDGLREAAAVVFAQMPRPRLLITLGSATGAPLPAADIQGSRDQAGLVAAVARARTTFERAPWSPEPPAFTRPELANSGDDGEQHLSSDEEHPHAQESEGPGHGDMGHDDHGDMGHDDMDHDDHGHMAHDDHDHMAHDHDDGFMSMIMMTKDLPRSRDGLAMEWIDAPFGPLFPGLPAGLAPVLTLDGDVVATVKLADPLTSRNLPEVLRGPASKLPDRLATLDPTTPTAYRLLAERTLAAAGDQLLDDRFERTAMGAVEWERIRSHLGWLAAFGELLGLAWLADRAAELQVRSARSCDWSAVTAVQPAIEQFVHRAGRVPLLRQRLAGIGRIEPDGNVALHGPVGRGSGIVDDARTGDASYQETGFTPVVCAGGDAWARFQVRLAEIQQSLGLAATAGAITMPRAPRSASTTGRGVAMVETPRGVATLALTIDDGTVIDADLHTPTMDHIALVPGIAQGLELADALVAIASLDLSAWEIER